MIHERRKTVQDVVYESLREEILDLKLAPGTAISESDISGRFNVSRTPVREAFIHLSKENLVQVIPQKGSFVSLIDYHRVEQEFYIRETIELAVLELFLEKCTSKHIEALENEIREQEEARNEESYVKHLFHDDAFHRVFYEGAGQPLAWDVVSTWNGHYRRVRLLTLHFRGIAANVTAQHKSIVDALKQRDLSGARRLLSRHIYKIEVEESLLRSEYPTYFAEREKK
jgi:DNA-binding GntR family transcriptional regulator